MQTSLEPGAEICVASPTISLLANVNAKQRKADHCMRASPPKNAPSTQRGLPAPTSSVGFQSASAYTGSESLPSSRPDTELLSVGAAKQLFS